MGKCFLWWTILQAIWASRSLHLRRWCCLLPSCIEAAFVSIAAWSQRHMKAFVQSLLEAQSYCCLFSIPLGIDGWCLVLPRASRTRPERSSESPSDCFLFHYSLSSCINKVILSAPYFTALTFQGKCDFKIGHHPRMMPGWQRMLFLQAVQLQRRDQIYCSLYVFDSLSVWPGTNSSDSTWEHVEIQNFGLFPRPTKSQYAF